MAYFSRYGRRYRRYRKYRRFYRKYRRGRKYINATSRSSARIKTSFTETSKLYAGGSTEDGTVYYTLPYGTSSAQGSVSHSLLYQTYCNLYEEVKIVGVKVSLGVISPVGDSATPSLQIYTAWDRKRGATEAAPTANDIKESSTYNVATALNNNVAKLSRACYASDLMEKATWIDASLSVTKTNEAWTAAAKNPNMFCPSFLLYCLSPSLTAKHEIDVSISYTYYLAFRNPKYGGASSDSKLSDLGARAVSFPDDDDGDMTDDPPPAAVAAADSIDADQAVVVDDSPPPDPEVQEIQKAKYLASRKAASEARAAAIHRKRVTTPGPIVVPQKN